MIDKMIQNMPEKTGKTLEEWITVLRSERSTDSKHKEQVQLLMDRFGLGMNYADIIVHKTNGTDSGSANPETLIQEQYNGKEQLRPIFDKLMHFIAQFDDVETAPKKAYVSLRRKKQFACLKPATKTRFELELILKGQEPQGILEIIPGAGAMCTHKIKLESAEQITPEVLQWFELAFQKAN